MRIGIGYDVHRLTENRKCIIGGVEIPHTKGLLGHSDADVLVHAINDALLGAAALRDIGFHFPDTDMAYKDIDSLLLMERVVALLKTEGYTIVNVDATVMAEKPKIAPYVKEMIQKIAKVLEVDESAVNIKGTTTEKLGFVGREEGIAAEAVCLITKEKKAL